MSIPILDLNAQLQSYRQLALEAIERVIDSNQFILGPEVKRFERALSDWLQLNPDAVGVSSGTDALLVALMALEIGPGDEVIIPAMSFFATAGVVSRLGATPVFVDVDPQRFNVTERAVQAAITTRTKAIIPVHLFGQAADLGALYERPLSERPAIIEDAAQSLGATLRGRLTGQLGDLACTSFFPSKNLGCFGDGGAVYGRDEALLERTRVLRVHGSKPKYHHLMIGGNFRLDALQAAVLNVKLPLLDDWAQRRRANARYYSERFEALGLCDGRLATPYVAPDCGHVFNQYVIRCSQRDQLKAHLTERGVGTMIYYPSPLHTQPCFESLGYQEGDFPEAERACREVLAIPVYPELSEAERDQVVAAVASFFGGEA